jgi:hypothetical protein
MGKILGYLADYYREQHKGHFLLVTAFTAVVVVLNYRFDIEDGLIDRHYGSFKHFYLYFLLYTAGTVPVFLSYAYDEAARKDFLSKPAFWGRLVIGLAVFSFYCYFFQYRSWINESLVSNYYLRAFVRICADQMVQSSLMFVMLAAFWWWRDRKDQPLYGLSVRGVNIRPYFWMLAAMSPLIIGAGFFSSFTDYYPTARKLQYMSEHLHPMWLYTLGYELAYGFEFFHIEFFFRGFMILAFVKYAGSKAILPAAVFYCFVHFGKPMGECISSYFGGIILGILSFRTRSIAAGVMVHIGIAWMMEAVAAVWLFLKAV